MAQIILDSNNNLIQGDFDNATINNRTKFKTTTTNATTNVYAVPNGSATSAGFTVTNAADPTNASKLTIATNGSTDTQIISGVNGTGTYLPLSFYTNNTLAMQIGTNGQVTVAATANPAFSAYKSSNQTVSSNTWTKITFDTEEFDTNSNFASSRFTPTVAGYYQINAAIYFAYNGSGYTTVETRLYKNGSSFKNGTQSYADPYKANAWCFTTAVLVYLNGSTDYVEMYANTSGTTIYGSQLDTYMQGFLARSA